MSNTKYLTETENEFLVLSGLFEQKFLSGEIENDENAQAFFKVLQNMRKALNRKIKKKKNKEQQKEDDPPKGKHAVCGHCGKPGEVLFTGEGINENGHRVHECECPHCHRRFLDLIPLEDDQYVSFFENFIDHYEKGDKEGITTAKRLEVTTENFENVKKRIEAFKYAIGQIKWAEDQSEQYGEIAEEVMKGMIKDMYHIYGRMLPPRSEVVN